MGLIDLKTDLKSLRFGKDQLGGGSSGQPYIQTPFPEKANTLQLTKINGASLSYDFPIRGGALALINSTEDTTRIARFLLDAPKGPLFITKQVGLQLSNPRIETGKTLGIENTRIYNLGINTITQVASNAFGIHIDRAGALGNIQEFNKYEKIVSSINRNTPNENRLLKLYSNFNVGVNNDKKDLITQTALDIYNKITAKLNKFNNSRLGNFLNELTNNGLNRTIESAKEKASRALEPKYYKIDDYIGGPGSVYGLGNTTLNRYVFTDRYIYEDRVVPNLELNYQRFLGLSRFLYPLSIEDNQEKALVFNGEPSSTTSHPLVQTEGTSFTSTHLYDDINNTVTGKDVNNSHLNSLTFDYQLIKNQKIDPAKLVKPDFRQVINQEFGSNLPSTDYARFNMETRIGIGNPGKISRDRSKVNITDIDTVDKINMIPLFKEDISDDAGGTVVINGQKYSTRDLIKFRFEAVDNDNPSKTIKIVFRAFIDSFRDNLNADWQPYEYNGRGESFYTYKKFSRSANISFKIAAQSRDEMKPLYQKLNYLMSNLSPDYQGNGFMRGPFILMTVGNWFYRTPGIINNLSLDVKNNYPWEIAMNEPESGNDETMAELPQILDASMTFTPIHNFIPRKGPDVPFIYTGTHAKNYWLKPEEFINLK